MPLPILPEDANPCQTSGERNLDCPYYIICLDIAAANMWAEFTCDFCIYQRARQDKRIEDMDFCAPGWEDIWGGLGT